MTALPERTPRVPLHRNADYVRLVAAQGFSITGREIETLVLPLLVLSLTNSPAQVGLVAAVQSVPYLLLSLPAGALVDRWSRRRVMVVCDAIRAACFASLPVAWLLGGLSLAQLYIVAAIASSAFVFYNIAEISGLTQVVPPDDLPRAMSINTVVEWIGENAGPALGGALAGLGRTIAAGAVLAYGVQAAMLAASAGFLATIKTAMRADRAPEARRPWLREIGDGIGWLRRQPVVRTMALQAMALNIIFAPVGLALIVRTRDGFHASPAAIGLMFSAGGGAGLGAALIAPRLRARVRIGVILTGIAPLWALGLAAVAASPSMVTLAAAWLVVPAGSGLGDVASVSYRLSLIPPDMQGRVNSVFRFMAWGLRPASLAFGGWLIGAIGAQPALWCAAAAMAVVAIASFVSPLRQAA